MSRIAAWLLLMSACSGASASSGEATVQPSWPSSPSPEPSVDLPSTSPGTSSFPKDDAETALRAARGGLRSCADSAVPRALDVTVRFEPSGRVSSVTVSPADGRVASCVRTRLAEISIPAFHGESVALHMPVQL